MKEFVICAAVALFPSMAYADSPVKSAADLNREFWASMAENGTKTSTIVHLNGSKTVCYEKGGCTKYPPHYELRNTFFDSSAGPLNKYGYKCQNGFAFYFTNRAELQIQQLLNEAGQGVTCSEAEPS